MAQPIRKWRKLTRQKWLNLHEVTYLDPAGREKQWQLASRRPKPKCVTGDFTLPDAVVIVPFHAQKKQMVLTREYRVVLADFEYGFPAGLVDPGETPTQAAFRELAEETGLTVTRLVHSGPTVYSSAGMTDESVSMIYVECDGTPSTGGNQGSERIEVLLAGPKEVRRLCEDPGIKFDAKAWLVLTVFGRTGNPWSFFPSA
jgi:ADP-ribose pyrophosphatase